MADSLIQIIPFLNPHRNSISYVVQVSANEAILIDCGNFQQSNLDALLERAKLRLTSVLLTHEHSDHIIGLNPLLDRYNVTVYCTERCEKNAADSKLNYSRYTEIVETFEVHMKANHVKSREVLHFGSLTLNVLETPGHSPGSAIFYNDQVCFSGDTILNESKTPLIFPNSNKENYLSSVVAINSCLKSNTIIYPGHGEAFEFYKWKFNNSIHV